jgi:hypothetical protein
MDLTSSDLAVYVPAAVLVLIAVVTAIAVWARSRRLIRLLDDRTGFLAAMAGPVDGAMDGLGRAVREHLVRVDDEVYVLSRPLPELRREYAEHEIGHSVWFSVGAMLTGLALIATFVLIAVAMYYDVSGAIRESGGSDDTGVSTQHLAAAVGLLGGKFVISAIGVACSVLVLLVTTRRKGDVYRRAEHPPRELLAHFSSVEAYDLKVRAEQHRELCEHLVTMNRSIERLESIEVSVKTIGNDVSANLKTIMKDAMGEQLSELLQQTMIDVDQIARRVEQHLTTAFAEQMRTVVTAIEGQAQGQLDQILTRLQDTLSGGFQSESHKMVAALESFGKVVPALEEQLRAMTGQIAEETQKRGEETARTTQAVLEQVASVVQALGAQQAASAHEVERIQSASADGVAEILRRLEAGVTAMVGDLVATSRGEVAIAGSAAQELRQSAQAVQEMSQYIHATLVEAKRSSDAMSAAAAGFSGAGRALLEGVEAMRTMTEASRLQTRDQAALLQQQQAHTTRVEQMWPSLFEVYLAKFRESAENLARAWSELDRRLERVNNAVGATFAENTEVLSDAVEKLVKLHSNGRAAAR